MTLDIRHLFVHCPPAGKTTVHSTNLGKPAANLSFVARPEKPVVEERLKAAEVKLGDVKPGEVKPGEVKLGEVKPGEVKKAEFDADRKAEVVGSTVAIGWNPEVLRRGERGESTNTGELTNSGELTNGAGPGEVRSPSSLIGKLLFL